MLWFSSWVTLIEMFLLAITFHFSSSIQLVEHMLILVVPHVLFVCHPRFGIAACRRINRFLQYLLEIKGRRDWAKRGLSVSSPQKITLDTICHFESVRTLVKTVVMLCVLSRG